MPSLSSLHFGHWLMQFFAASFLAICFLQSGADKVLDWGGNLKFLQGHFAKSPLSSAVPLLLGTLTVLELCAGGCSLIGVLELLIKGSPRFAFFGASLSAASFLALFFGQRMAKDYAGATGLTPYFLVSLAAMFLCER